MDRASNAVNGVMRAAVTPRNRDMALGWKMKAAYFVHHLFPRLSHRISANIVFKNQIKEAPPAPASSGNLFKSQAPSQVETDVKERMKEEKRVRRR